MPTLVAPAALVVGAPRIPFPFGLYSAINMRPEGDGRWQTGVTWEPDTCEPIAGIGDAWCSPDAITGIPKDLDMNGVEVGRATAFTVYGHYTCSAMGSWNEAQDRATRHLNAREEATVEATLWSGGLGNVPNFLGVNGYPAPVTAAAADVEHALADVEAGIAQTYGSLGVIHMSRETASLLKNRLTPRGGRMFTLIGTPVAIGAGYPQGVIIGTPAMFGYRSEVFTSSNRQGDLLDRTNNDLTAVAERTVLIGFDPCPVIKVTFTP